MLCSRGLLPSCHGSFPASSCVHSVHETHLPGFHRLPSVFKATQISSGLARLSDPSAVYFPPSLPSRVLASHWPDNSQDQLEWLLSLPKRHCPGHLKGPSPSGNSSSPGKDPARYLPWPADIPWKRLAVTGNTRENTGPPEQGTTCYCFSLLLTTSGAVDPAIPQQSGMR